MKKIKMQEGITLVALIITIVILIILATVSIPKIKGDSIIDKAQNAADEYTVNQEKSNLKLEVLDWQSVSNNKTLSEYLGEKYGTDNIQTNDDGSVTVTVLSGNKYTVTEDAQVE